jgi:outer membrane protein insertion porin family
LINSKNRYFLAILLPLLMSSCLGTRYLKENERRLVAQNIKAPASVDEDALSELYAQRENRRLFRLPIYHLVGMYYYGLKHYDREKFVRKKEKFEKKIDAKIARTTNQRKINNLQFRKQKKIDKYNSRIENGNQFMQWGEPVAVYDSALMKLTVERFSSYLFSEGYFHNTVSTKLASFGRFVSVTYRVDPGDPYIMDSIVYRVSDSTIHTLIESNSGAKLLKRGDRYREKALSSERERLDLMLKDNGYYDFSRQYVDFQLDTSALGNKRAIVHVNIGNPAKRGYHKKFIIDSVRFVTDAGLSRPGETRQSKVYRDVRYMYFDDNYKPKVLSQRLFIAPHAAYSRSNTFNSQRQLANLDAFKFVNINYDTSGGNFVANIFTSPLDRYEWSNEVGVNVTQGYPGPFYNINFKKRNIFRGLENLELNGRIGIEGVAAATGEDEPYRSTEAGLNASIVFPQFLWPLRESTQIRFGKYNPKTRLLIGYSFSDRPEYRRTSTTFANTYTWQNRRTTQFSLALTNISLINSTIRLDEFEELLASLDSAGNYNLARSFKPSFVSSMIFGITWNKNYGAAGRSGVYIRTQFESGGTSLNFIDPKIISDRGLQYFKYLRLNFDYRKVDYLNKWATLAYRFNSGIAYSYGSNRSLPYEKFFFAGGSNSIRAWRPRRLGLGSTPPEVSDNPRKDGYFNYQFEKPGDILLEGSIELRSKLFGFIDGAVFVDAGNVWAFQNPFSSNGDDVVGNSQLDAKTFLREIAVGTGFGLRFDFTFLILRFDVGVKVYDPARPEDDRFVLNKMKFFGPFARRDELGNYYDLKEPVIYNIGIGYPF